MEKLWLKNYPKGVPTEIDPKQYATVVEFFDKTCAKYQSRSAFECMGTSMSFADIDRASKHFAAYLQKVVGIKKGDRVAIQMPNCLQYPIALFGVLRAGAVVVNTNPLYTAREMEHQFKDSGATAIVIMANFASVLEGVLPKTKIRSVVVTEIGDLLKFPMNLVVNTVAKRVKKMVPPFEISNAVSFKDALLKGAAQHLDPVQIGADDLAFLQYTGGTTGVSKGAMLLHRNIVANMLQIVAWLSPYLEVGKEIVITPLPLYHIFSLTVNCLTCMCYGATNVLIPNPRDIPGFIKTMSKYPFTVFTGVNTLYIGLMNNPEFAKLDFSKFKFAVGGGMAVQKAVAEKWKKITGHSLIEGYGLTESSPVLSVNPLDGREQTGSIGLPVPSTDIRIVKEDGTEAEIGERGEICGRGPQLMAGYWQKPEETEKVIVDGWLHTGDIGIMQPDGFVRIVDRIKDMILVSGFNVYPNEIEDVLATHPGVLEVAAIGIPDAKSGESVKVFVVPRDPSLTVEDIAAFCKEQFTGYKRPKHIELRKELPKTNVGKILRRALKEEQKNDGSRLG